MNSKKRRIKGRRVKTIDAYFCSKFMVRIVQKLRFCTELYDDFCTDCPYKKIDSEDTSVPDNT